MRHNESIKRMLAAGLLTLGAWGANAQEMSTWTGSDGGNWNLADNWSLPSGNHYVPSNNSDNEFTAEYANISNGHTVNVLVDVPFDPFAIVLGDTGGSSGHLVMANGSSLAVDDDGYGNGDLPYAGQVMIGRAGTGSLVVNGATLTATHGVVVSGGAGGTGTLTLNSGTITSEGKSVFGVGGGGVATINIHGGSFVNNGGGIFEIGAGGGGSAIVNMTGGSLMINSNTYLNYNGTSSEINLSGDALFSAAGQILYNLAGGTRQSDLMVSGNATVTARQYRHYFDTSVIHTKLMDNAHLVTTERTELNSGRFTVVGGNVDLQAGGFIVRGSAVYNPVITASGISAVQITGDNSVSIGGTLEIELEGVSANLGDSWVLFTGGNAAVGSFDKIVGPKLGDGVRFNTVMSGNVVRRDC